MHYVYVLQNHADGDEFYLGSTSNLKQRLQSHNGGESKSTRGKEWKLVYYEAYPTLSAARDREYRLKHNGKARASLMRRIKAAMQLE